MNNPFEDRHKLLDAYLFAESVMAICYEYGIKSTDDLKQRLAECEKLRKDNQRHIKLLKSYRFDG